MNFVQLCEHFFLQIFEFFSQNCENYLNLWDARFFSFQIQKLFQIREHFLNFVNFSKFCQFCCLNLWTLFPNSWSFFFKFVNLFPSNTRTCSNAQTLFKTLWTFFLKVVNFFEIHGTQELFFKFVNFSQTDELFFKFVYFWSTRTFSNSWTFVKWSTVTLTVSGQWFC